MNRMGTRLLLLPLILIGFLSGVSAQPGLSVTIPQRAGTKMALSAYTGLDLVVMDSITDDGSGFFRVDSVLPLGMYVVEGEGFSVEFLSIGNPVEFRLDDLESPYTVRFSSDLENTRWTAYLALREQYHYGYEDPGLFMQLTDSLMDGSTGYAARLIEADRAPELTDADFLDADLIPTNVLTTKMVRFLERSDQPFVVSCDTLLKKAKVSLPMYEFVLQYLLKGFTAMGLSEVTDHLLNFPQLAEGEITAEEGARLLQLTEPYQKVRVGAKAPDIDMVTVDGRPYHLYDSHAQRIIVFFWAADCEYCHDFMTEIRKNLDLENDYEMVTFAIADDEKEVRRELRKLKIRGFHCFDKDRWEGKAFLDYHIMSTPTAFLLDENKMIIAKPYNWEEMRRIEN